VIGDFEAGTLSWTMTNRTAPPTRWMDPAFDVTAHRECRVCYRPDRPFERPSLIVL